MPGIDGTRVRAAPQAFPFISCLSLKTWRWAGVGGDLEPWTYLLGEAGPDWPKRAFLFLFFPPLL